MFSAPGNVIVRKPLISFFVLTLLISYGVGIPFNIFMTSVLDPDDEIISGLVPRLITVYAPAIAAIVVTAFSNGHDGVNVLLKKLLPQARHLGWIVGIPILLSALTFFSFVIGGISLDEVGHFLSNSMELLILQFIGQVVIVGIGEELGWRGWLLPRLTQRLSLTHSMLIVTFVWGIWHFPVFFGPFRVVTAWCMILISTSIIITWVWYKVQGNVFVLAVVHASVNAPEVFLENQLSKSPNGHQSIESGWEMLGYAYLSVAAILVICTYRLWFQNAVYKRATVPDQFR